MRVVNEQLQARLFQIVDTADFQALQTAINEGVDLSYCLEKSKEGRSLLGVHSPLGLAVRKLQGSRDIIRMQERFNFILRLIEAGASPSKISYQDCSDIYTQLTGNTDPLEELIKPPEFVSVGTYLLDCVFTQRTPEKERFEILWKLVVCHLFLAGLNPQQKSFAPMRVDGWQNWETSIYDSSLLQRHISQVDAQTLRSLSDTQSELCSFASIVPLLDSFLEKSQGTKQDATEAKATAKTFTIANATATGTAAPETTTSSPAVAGGGAATVPDTDQNTRRLQLYNRRLAVLRQLMHKTNTSEAQTSAAKAADASIVTERTVEPSTTIQIFATRMQKLEMAANEDLSRFTSRVQEQRQARNAAIQQVKTDMAAEAAAGGGVICFPFIWIAKLENLGIEDTGEHADDFYPIYEVKAGRETVEGNRVAAARAEGVAAAAAAAGELQPTVTGHKRGRNDAVQSQDGGAACAVAASTNPQVVGVNANDGAPPAKRQKKV